MNVRDPFGLHRNTAFDILRTTATQAAAGIRDKAIEAGATAIERSKQAVEDMSFTVPKNVPSFNNPQRLAEDYLWHHSSGGPTPRRGGGGGGGGGQHQGILGGVQDKVGEFLSDATGNSKRTLPMYKDKPYAYPPSQRLRPIYRRKRVLGFLLLFVLGVLYWTGAFEKHKERVTVPLKNLSWLKKDEKAKTKADWLKRRDRVVEAFELSWDAYERYAWGYDEFHPESKRGRQMAAKGMGWIIVDSLDTMILMNLTSRLTHAREWVSKTLTYDQDQDVNTFETTIRMMGGLLSAHYLSNEYPELAPLKDDDPGAAGEDLYLEKAKDLADRLLSAFESPSGIPYASVNLGQYKGIPAHDNMGASSTAEAATLQLEFKYLAKLTGEKLFWDKVEKVMEVLDGNNESEGLVPIFVNANDGKFHGKNIRLGSRGDSYYEYLIKQYLQTNKKEKVYEDMWYESLAAVRKHLVTYTEPSGFTIIGERESGLEGTLTPKMDHLVCFMPGTIALAATGGLTEKEARKLKTWTKRDDEDMKLARELMHTCWGMYKYMATGLAAEITYFNVANPPLTSTSPHKTPPAVFDPSEDAAWRKDFEVHPQDVHNLQRPETVESLFYMWRITGDVKYREWGWEMFKSFMNYTAVEDGGGFTSLTNANVIPPVSRDNMESFWLAETLKYMYLLFSPDDLLPLDKIVLNTEAHPLPRFDMGQLFSTGWKRKPRDAHGNAIKSEAAAPRHAFHHLSSTSPPAFHMDRDVELNNILTAKEDSITQGSVYNMMQEPSLFDGERRRRPGPRAARSAVGRWVDSFRRDPERRVTMPAAGAFAKPPSMSSQHHQLQQQQQQQGEPLMREHSRASTSGASSANGHYYDLHGGIMATANTALARELKGRHLQMIAIGGSIGTGLFVTSGKALATGGPASLLIAYCFVGVMLYCTVHALGELAVAFPVSGSFSAFSTRFLDPSWGFAMGWNYALQWLVVLPLEIIAASITIEYWNSSIPRAVFVTIFLLAIISINLFGVKGYGEAEFIFAIIKVTAVIGFILLGIVINIGGTQDEGYIGGKYWHDPGPFQNGFKGMCSVFVTAAFAFTGTELIGLAAAETANPRKSLPTAIKQVFWRITLFYVVALTLVGLLVSSENPKLLGKSSADDDAATAGAVNGNNKGDHSSSGDSSASPFVIAIESAGIAVLPSVMNSVILIAVISVGNSAVFGSSRTLAALADLGQAPRVLSYVDRRGRPLVAIVFASSLGFLAYLADLPQQADVLSWLVAISALSSIFTWGSICLAHIRFRRAWAARGRSLESLAFRSQPGVLGSWVGLGLNALVLVTQFWVGAWPVGYGDKTPAGNARSFFLQYMAVPILLIMWLGHKAWFRTKVVRVRDMDLDTGRRDFNLTVLVAQEHEEKAMWPRWKKIYRFFC
ncbi:uncharacterized protein E0L32_001035 [Thyridium curvatum]|uniref:alpha-1,2-Mannosidase n=1 Tax=Thyridium curvatum TaxID=1093900 RepID=A0A507AUQ5_9PEZI|nr:uncharacterized protein E0L32_001035 [Thyridium curvatum]TPX11217.1 hypothetical protein E0L32_001035 [Thyridium curvatum]